MSRNQMEFETANGEMITLELSDETRAACNSYFVAAARTLLENYRKVEFEMRTAKHQLEDLKARGEKGSLPHRSLSKTEVIEMMCHPGVSTDCERVKSSNISDPTARIALNYEKEYDRLMAELNDEPAYYKEQLLICRPIASSVTCWMRTLWCWQNRSPPFQSGGCGESCVPARMQKWSQISKRR